MFVTPDDFNVTPYNIPNLKAVANTFPLYIEEKERRVLSKLLGVQLYNQFIAGLNALPPEWENEAAYNIGEQVLYGSSIWEAIAYSIGVEPVEGIDWTLVEVSKWVLLRDGTEYSYPVNSSYPDNQTFVWVGMKQMLKPYIYSEWLKDTFDSHSGIGIVESKAENSNVISPAKRIVDAYNEFAFIAGTSDGIDAYEEYYDYGAYGYYGYTYNSLAGFIYAANALLPDTYANWIYYDVRTMNTFGI